MKSKFNSYEEYREYMGYSDPSPQAINESALSVTVTPSAYEQIVDLLAESIPLSEGQACSLTFRKRFPQSDDPSAQVEEMKELLRHAWPEIERRSARLPRSLRHGFKGFTVVACPGWRVVKSGRYDYYPAALEPEPTESTPRSAPWFGPDDTDDVVVLNTIWRMPFGADRSAYDVLLRVLPQSFLDQIEVLGGGDINDDYADAARTALASLLNLEAEESELIWLPSREAHNNDFNELVTDERLALLCPPDTQTHPAVPEKDDLRLVMSGRK